MLRIRNIAGVLVLAAIGLSCQSGVSRAPRKFTPEQIADRAKPATVWILTEIEATARVPELSVDTAALAIASESKLQEEATAAGKYRVLMNVLLDNPSRFFIKTSSVREAKSQVDSGGTGLIFTPDGYIATNAHVVMPGESEVKKSVLSSVKKWVESDVTELEETVKRVLPNTDITDEAKGRFFEALANYYFREGEISNVTRTVYAVTGYTQNGEDIIPVRMPCVVKKVGSPIPGKDVAILKVDGSNMPTVPLAASLQQSGIRTGSEVDVIGYPGAVSIASDLTLPSRLESSQTTGHVSGIRTMAGGWRVVQTDTVMNPGNSGGPALDDMGDVIGLATYKLEGGDGINFIVAIDVVREFLQELSVQPSMSAFTRTYLEALDDLDRGRKSRALTSFRGLQAIHPGIRSLNDFVNQLDESGVKVAQTEPRRVEARSDPSPSAPGEKHRLPVLLFVGIALVVAIGIAIIVASNR